MIRLGDDGTMDTVLVCTDCGEEFRFNFQDDNEPRGEDSSAAYDYFVDESIAEVTEEHDCGRPEGTDGHTAVTSDNYFDAAKGLYWYCSDNHGGQASELYSILSARLEYTPASSERGPDHDDESSVFYAELIGGGWNATELLDAIKTHTGKDD